MTSTSHLVATPERTLQLLQQVMDFYFKGATGHDWDNWREAIGSVVASVDAGASPSAPAGDVALMREAIELYDAAHDHERQWAKWTKLVRARIDATAAE